MLAANQRTRPQPVIVRTTSTARPDRMSAQIAGLGLIAICPGLHVGAHNVSNVDIYYNAGLPGGGAACPCRAIPRRRGTRATGRVMLTRRHMLAAGGGGLAILAMPSVLRAKNIEVIEMRGTPRGERISGTIRSVLPFPAA